MQAKFLSLRKKIQGALPVVEHFLQALGLKQHLARQIPHPPAVAALDLLVKSVLLQPSALYRIRGLGAELRSALASHATSGRRRSGTRDRKSTRLNSSHL